MRVESMTRDIRPLISFGLLSEPPEQKSILLSHALSRPTHVHPFLGGLAQLSCFPSRSNDFSSRCSITERLEGYYRDGNTVKDR